MNQNYKDGTPIKSGDIIGVPEYASELKTGRYVRHYGDKCVMARGDSNHLVLMDNVVFISRKPLNPVARAVSWVLDIWLSPIRVLVESLGKLITKRGKQEIGAFFRCSEGRSGDIFDHLGDPEVMRRYQSIESVNLDLEALRKGHNRLMAVRKKLIADRPPTEDENL